VKPLLMSYHNRDALEEDCAGYIVAHRKRFGLEPDDARTTILRKLLRGITTVGDEDFADCPLDVVYNESGLTPDEREYLEIRRLQPSAADPDRARRETRMLLNLASDERKLAKLEQAVADGDLERVGRIVRKPTDSAPTSSTGKTDTPKPPAVRPWRPFPLETLPEYLREFVVETSRAIGVDQSMLAIGALATAAGAIGNAIVVEIPGRKPERIALWFGIVAKSGAGKSPALEAALEPVQGIERERHEEARKENAGVHDASERVKAERMIVDDVTPECLFGILADNPRGMISVPDELAGFLAGLGRYGAGAQAKTGDAAQYCRLYDGRPMRYDRKGGKESVYLASPLTSIVGGIPPDTLRQLATKDLESQGLIPRLALIMPPTPRQYFSEDRVDPLAGSRYRFAIRDLCRLPCPIEKGVPQSRVLRPSRDALGSWITYHDQLVDEAHALDGVKSSTVSKSKHYALRIAAILHALQAVGVVAATQTDADVLDKQPVSTAHPVPEVIGADTMGRAIDLSRWILAERLRVLDMIATDAETLKLHDLAGSIDWAKHPDGITPNELYKSRKTTFADSEAAERLLRKCHELGLLGMRYGVRGARGQGGRDTLIFTSARSCASETLAEADEGEGFGVSSDDEETEGDDGED
jgi:hypothetical protein